MEKAILPSTFYLPTEITFSPNFADCPSVPGKKILIIASRSVSQKLLELTIDGFIKNGVQADILCKKGGEPDSAMLENFTVKTHNNYEAILAIGGGSVIDTAKALALLKLSEQDICTYEFSGPPITGVLPIYAVPTTCGSGSEVTPYSVITNSGTGRKFTITHNALRPAIAYINPNFFKELPRQVILSSTLDAFIHNLEALLNTTDNVLITPWATEGLRLIFQNLEAALQDPDHKKIQCRLARASLYGGISIAHSRTGLAHTMSAAFAEFSSEPHGLLNAKLLPYAMRFNCMHYNGKLARIATSFTGRNYRTDQSAGQHISDWLQELIDQPIILNCHDMAAYTDHVVDRVLQDKGLTMVNAAPVNRQTLKQLLEEIIDEQI